MSNSKIWRSLRYFAKLLCLQFHLYVKVTQSSRTLCDSMGCSLPGSSVRGILQARVLGWLAVPFSRVSSQSRDWTQVSNVAGGFFTVWATREAPKYWSGQPIPSPGDLPDPGIELRSPALQVDSLPSELPGKCSLICWQKNKLWSKYLTSQKEFFW